MIARGFVLRVALVVGVGVGVGVLGGCDRSFLAPGDFASVDVGLDGSGGGDGGGDGDVGGDGNLDTSTDSAETADSAASTDAGSDGQEVDTSAEPDGDAVDTSAEPDGDAVDTSVEPDAVVADTTTGAPVCTSDADCKLAGCAGVATCSGGVCTGNAGVFTFAASAQGALAAVRPLANGGAVAVGRLDAGPGGGSDAWLLHLDAAGHVVHSVALGGALDEAAHEVATLAGGELAVVGERGKAGDADWHWQRVGLDGQIVLQKDYPSAGDGRLLAVIATPNGGYAAAGMVTAAATAADGVVAGLDGTGNVIWQWTSASIGDDSLRAIASMVDGVVAAGPQDAGKAVGLVRLGADGALRWRHRFGALAGAALTGASVHGVASDASGEIVAVGRREKPGTTASEALMLRLSPAGALRWHGALAGAGDGRLVDVAARADGRWVAFGSVGLPSKRAPWLLTLPAHSAVTNAIEAKELTTPTGAVEVLAGALGPGDTLLWAGSDVAAKTSSGWLGRSDPFGNLSCAAAGLCALLTSACDDGNPCTLGVCSAATGCTQLPSAGPCEDGKPCTTGDSCSGSQCKAGIDALFEVKASKASTGRIDAMALRAAGGLWTVGTVTANADLSVRVERRSSTGAVLASAQRGGAASPGAFAAVEWPDGGLAVIGVALNGGPGQGGDAWVERADTALGDAAWSKTFGGPGAQWLRGGALDSEGAVVVVGGSEVTGAAKAYTARLTSAGELLDVKAFGDGANQSLAAALHHDGAVWAVGQRVASAGDKADLWLVQFAAQSAIATSFTLGEPEYDERGLALARHPGGWLVAGTRSNNTPGGGAGWIAATDEAGKQLWEEGLGSSGSNVWQALVRFADGRIIAGGVQGHDPPSGNEGWLFRANPSGDYIDELYVGGDGDDGVTALLLDVDGGLLLAGYRGESGGKTVPWLQKRDPWANTSCGGGACFATSYASCDDANLCTYDSCDPSKGCAHSTYSDGTWCGGAGGDGVCHAGGCKAPPAGKVYVTGGGFWMGHDGGPSAAAPAHKVNVAGVWLDRYEVSVDSYLACVSAKGCSAPQIVYAAGSAALYNYGRPDAGSHPVNGVTWQQAHDYCAWAGGRLPTEAEWELAARGRCPDQTDLNGCKPQMRSYPWGEEAADCSRAVVQDASGPGCGAGTTAVVGSKPDGAASCEAQDMAGNVWEWVADFYDSGYYAISPSDNPKGPANGATRVRRGGAFFDMTGQDAGKQAWNRAGESPTGAGYHIGFRCAITP